MTFSEHRLNEKVIGQSFISDSFLFFFGNKYFQRQDFNKAFPELDFVEVKQVHGDHCVQASNKVVEADAHWTEKVNTALLIKTADCMPLLLHQGQRILAIHSGWRGTYANILLKAFNMVFQKDQDFIIACGPFIQQKSFEVDLSLANKFKEKFPAIEKLFNAPLDAQDKAHIDLKSVLKWQIQQLPQSKAFVSDIDTKTHTDYSSYRREPEANLRNYSFVARLK